MKLLDLAKQAWRRVMRRRRLQKPSAPKIQPPPVSIPPKQYRPKILNPPPPPQPRTVPTAEESRDIKSVQEVYDEIELIGRDASYNRAGAVSQLMDKMRHVKSSNVWGYYFEIEGSPHTGLLYVTFLKESSPGGARPNAPGSTYVYYDVPTKKYQQFARASESSAGKAVWDYLRVRETVWQHQHRYRFLQNEGEYVPRKVTKTGFRSRAQTNPLAKKIPNHVWSSLSRLEKSPVDSIRDYATRMRRHLSSTAGHRRSTLAPRTFLDKSKQSETLLNGGSPNRGRPNRGRPNRGEA
ncbi:MAG: KTSC domain-containing protein [Pirellulaceae bacterium]|nr:KTSC domain-containing protein [Pirellulaceae bacterium]